MLQCRIVGRIAGRKSICHLSLLCKAEKWLALQSMSLKHQPRGLSTFWYSPGTLSGHLPVRALTPGERVLRHHFLPSSVERPHTHVMDVPTKVTSPSAEGGEGARPRNPGASGGTAATRSVADGSENGVSCGPLKPPPP